MYKRQELRPALLDAAIGLTDQNQLSSLHITFCTEDEAEALAGRHGLLHRITQQFHWENRGYGSFTDFLNDLSSRKRKMIRKERETAQSAGPVSYTHLDVYKRQVYDRVLGSRSEATLVALSALATLLFLALGLLDAARSRVMARIGARIQERMDRRVFSAAMRRLTLQPNEPTAVAAQRDLEAVQRLWAVSYTHLDVYKRQYKFYSYGDAMLII